MKTIAITAISLLLFSYNHAAAATAVQQQEEKLELNKGKKWKVDSNMMGYIRQMEQDVSAFSTAPQKDYGKLSDKLKANINGLTSNCTMKGKPHDALHKWLLPYISLVNQLSKAKNDTEAAAHFAGIQTSFKTFNQYFQ
jgi:hypothetical protein